jgi:hypothetical protein
LALGDLLFHHPSQRRNRPSEITCFHEDAF